MNSKLHWLILAVVTVALLALTILTAPKLEGTPMASGSASGLNR